MTLSPGFASILRSGRPEFNARFAAARHLYPDLDAAAFAEFLRGAANELLSAVERVRPDRAADVAMAAYDAALELVGEKLAGPGARLSTVEEAWRKVLPAAAALCAIAPGRLIAAVCNAAHQIASTPGALPARWIETMSTLGPQCDSVETFLKLGQVAGWRAGLAHFRESALALAVNLPEKLVLTAAGAGPATSWRELQQRLSANPWFDPSEESGGSSVPRVALRAGAFRGFGGLFSEPPLVAVFGPHFLARSGGNCWLLTADAFGATFHRAALPEFESALRKSRLPAGLQISGAGVTWNGGRLEFVAPGEVTSAAANSTTLALTYRFTHSIVLVALQ